MRADYRAHLFKERCNLSRPETAARPALVGSVSLVQRGKILFTKNFRGGRGTDAVHWRLCTSGTAPAEFPCDGLLRVPFRGRMGSRICGAMKHKNSHLLVGYWSRLRAGREVPDQTDIDPRAIKRLLSYTFILDCENPARPVYRLAGTALVRTFRFRTQGHRLSGPLGGAVEPVAGSACCGRRSSCASRFACLPSPPPRTMAWWNWRPC